MVLFSKMDKGCDLKWDSHITDSEGGEVVANEGWNVEKESSLYKPCGTLPFSSLSLAVSRVTIFSKYYFLITQGFLPVVNAVHANTSIRLTR